MTHDLLQLYLNPLLVFLLILSRVSGLVMTAPVFSGRGVPMQIRGLLAVGVALLITPLHWTVEVAHPGNLLHLLVLMGSEMLLGLALGLGVMILFTGLQLAGQIVSQMSGMALADVFDPGFDSSVPILGQLLDLFALAIFLIIGGHRQVLLALLDTFQWTPPGRGGFSSGLLDMLVEVTGQSFLLGIRVAAPAMVALLIAVLILGLISRTLPQLNVIAVGFNVNIMLLLVTLSLSLGTAAWIFQEQATATIDLLHNGLIGAP